MRSTALACSSRWSGAKRRKTHSEGLLNVMTGANRLCPGGSSSRQAHRTPMRKRRSLPQRFLMKRLPLCKLSMSERDFAMPNENPKSDPPPPHGDMTVAEVGIEEVREAQRD